MSFYCGFVCLIVSFQLFVAQPGIAQSGSIGTRIKDAAIARLIAKFKKEFYERLGHIVGDELPVKLDAQHQKLPQIQPPSNFHPHHIACTPQNMNTRLAPGDYTCEVRLYCQKDSEHRPGKDIAYEFAQYQGPQAEALATLVFRGTVRNIPPQTLQLITWQLEDGMAVSELPTQQQALVQELIPESAKSLNSNPITELRDLYNSKPVVHDLISFDELLKEGGEPGRIFLKLEHSQAVLKTNALNYERADEQVFDGPPADRTIRPPSPEVSPWSEIRPGVIGQLTIENGNLGLNKFSFRVLPKTATHTELDHPHLVYTSYGQLDLSLSDYLTLAEIFGSIAQPELAPELLADAAKRRLGRALLGYAEHYGAQAMLMMMAQNGEGESGSNDNDKADLTDEKGKKHILEGDSTGGGHRAGTGVPNKSEFPSSWSDDKILEEISDVATAPDSKRYVKGGKTIAEGMRDGVEIRVIIDKGRIVTGYPINLPRNP